MRINRALLSVIVGWRTQFCLLTRRDKFFPRTKVFLVCDRSLGPVSLFHGVWRRRQQGGRMGKATFVPSEDLEDTFFPSSFRPS
jgi:hypothetical protein